MATRLSPPPGETRHESSAPRPDRPGRGPWIAAIIIVALMAFGAGVLVTYLVSGDLREEVTALTSEGETLRAEITAISGELDTVRSDLGGAEATVAACQTAIETAQGLSALFDEGAALNELWWEAPEGSVEEAEIESAQGELGYEIIQTFGRLDSQAEACTAD